MTTAAAPATTAAPPTRPMTGSAELEPVSARLPVASLTAPCGFRSSSAPEGFLPFGVASPTSPVLLPAASTEKS